MNGAVALPLDLPELRFSATGDCVVRRTVMRNGVRILTEQVPGARSATLGFWVAVGSRDELPEHYGSTHFLEHLLFKGTTTVFQGPRHIGKRLIGVGAQILRHLGVRDMRLLSSPMKFYALSGFDLNVVDFVHAPKQK